MVQAAGVFKVVAYKVEGTYGTVPSASGPVGQALRRVTSDLSLTKQTYQSNEIRPDQQVADFRHGVRSVEGTITGELSPKTYQDFVAAVVRKDFVSGSVTTSLTSITIGSATLGVYPLTRVGGSWLTDGFKVGDVVRLSGAGFTAANIAKNMMITAITSSTAASVIVLNGLTLTPEGPISASSPACTVTGMKTMAPTTGHTNKSYSIEHYFGDAGLTLSEVFTGCQPTKMDLQLPPTGISTISFGILGQNVTTAATQYFTTPAAVTTTGVTAAVNGVLMVNGALVASVTGFSISVSSERTGDAVVGSNTIATRFPGRITASGQMTAYFESATLRDLFINETAVGVTVVLTCDSTANSEFLAITLPRVKVGGASKSDGAGGIVQTFPFVGLYNSAGGTGINSDQSTIVIQDSAAT